MKYNVFVGEVVSFNYNGGSNPGERRLVEMLEVTPTLWRTWDFDKGDLRSFNPSKASNIKFVNDDYVKTVELSDLPSSVNPDKLMEGFEQDGYLVHQTDNRIVAVKTKTDVKSTRLVGGKNYVKIGDIFLMCTQEGGVNIDTYDDHINDATIADLIAVMTNIDIL
jgi:hypothetical protein